MKTTYREIQARYSKMGIEERSEILASFMDVDPENEDYLNQKITPLKQEVKIETQKEKGEGDK